MDAKGTTVTKECVGWVRGAAFADLPDDLVPESLVRIKALWNEQGAKAEIEVCNELSRYVKASFVPINVRHLSEISPLPTDIDAFIDAKRVSVEYFWWDDKSIIPMIDAHAFFDIPFNHPITDEELREWEISRDDPLYWAVSFYWCFDLDNGSDCCHLEDWRKLEFWINE